MVVGPPGTGKTDVAVQIISNLYHAFPSQKTLLVTHSNAALNDLFEKIMARDIDPRYFLRQRPFPACHWDRVEKRTMLAPQALVASRGGRARVVSQRHGGGLRLQQVGPSQLHAG